MSDQSTGEAPFLATLWPRRRQRFRPDALRLPPDALDGHGDYWQGPQPYQWGLLVLHEPLGDEGRERLSELFA